MLGAAVYVVMEALGRNGASVEVETVPRVIVGVLGLSINLVSMGLLRSAVAESLNVKGCLPRGAS